MHTADETADIHFWDTASFLASQDAHMDTSCKEVPAHVLSKVNLTTEQHRLLSSICWHEATHSSLEETLGALSKRSGVPAGVQCRKISW